MRKLISLITLLALTIGMTVNADCQDSLLQAYINNDMQVWENYLINTRFDSLTTSEKLKYLNYEYGYVAVCIDREKDEATTFLSRFEKHINGLDTVLTHADLLAYKSAFYAYDLKIHKSHLARSARRTLRFADEALEADSLSTMALTMNANLLFYRPRWLGGNKKRAYLHLVKARKLFENKGDTCCWNYYHCLQMITLSEQKYKIKLCEQNKNLTE